MFRTIPKDSVSSREVFEEGRDINDDSLTGAGTDNLVDEEVPHPRIRKSYSTTIPASTISLNSFLAGRLK